jgi:hypothetical protein
MRFAGWQKNVLLTAVSAAVALLAAEGVLRLLWHPDAENSVIRAQPLYGWALRPGATMHSRASDRGLDYHIRIDSLGLRDAERARRPAPGTRRILFLGDSMVFGAGVEAPQRCTELVETALGPGVEVVNAGVSGWGTDQEYLYLTHEGFGLHPDIVVLGVCMLNDVLNVMLPHELFGTAPKPRFVLDSGRLQLQPAAMRAAPPPSRRAAAFLKHSRLVHFVGRHVQLLRARLRPAPAPVQYWPEDIESDSSHWSVFRVPLTPRFAAAFGVTEALLGAMRDSCAARGIPFVVFAFPQKVEVDPKERDLELHHYGYDPQWFDLAAPYRRLRATSDSLGVPCIYPLPEFIAAAASGPLFFARDGHPNAAGHACAAQALAPPLRALIQEEAAGAHARRH